MLYYNGLLVAKSAIELGRMDLHNWTLGSTSFNANINNYCFINLDKGKIANYLAKISLLNNKDKRHA